MRRYALISATVVLTAAYAAASAQVSGPFVDAAVNAPDDIRVKQYDKFKENSKTLYFAANCGILSGLASGEWGATVIVREDALCSLDRSDSNQLLQDIERARDEGRNLKKQRGCGYWKEHADEVDRLKRYAERRVVTAVDAYAGGRVHCPQL